MLHRSFARAAALVAVAGAALLAPQGASAQQPDTAAARDSLARQVERLQRAVDSLRAAGERTTQRLMEIDERGVAVVATPRGAAADTGRRAIKSAQGIYGKPFVKRFGSGTAVGGYVDIEYINDIDAHASRFDQHRLIPFIFSEITDRIHFGTEIEFEHGAKLEVDDGEAEGSGEIKVEFATIDYTIAEPLNFRAGLLLAPLGRFNLVHDSPVNDLTDRPLVNRYILPTTLSQSGAGLFGTLYPSERSLLSYEAYIVNGFDAGIVDGGELSVREGTGEGGGDNNYAKSFVGRLAFSPFLGLELGASAHTGRYAEADGDFTGDERLTILALDATLQRGPFELLGEYGRVQADLPASAEALGSADEQDGYYVQGNWHFGHGILGPGQSSVFTAVARWDNVDMAKGTDGALLQRLTVGLNWRPIEDTVFKTDFQWNWNTPAGTTDRGDADRRLLLSVATYF